MYSSRLTLINDTKRQKIGPSLIWIEVNFFYLSAPGLSHLLDRSAPGQKLFLFQQLKTGALCSTVLYYDYLFQVDGRFRSMLNARLLKEARAEVELFALLHDRIEACEPIEFKLVLAPTQLREVHGERVFPEAIPAGAAGRGGAGGAGGSGAGGKEEWDAAALGKAVDNFFTRHNNEFD